MSNTNNQQYALFFVNSPTGGGAEKVCLTLATELNQQNIKSIFVTCYKRDFGWPAYIKNYCLDIKCKHFSVRNTVWQKFLHQHARTKFTLISAHLPMSWLVAEKSPWANECIYVLHNKIVKPALVPAKFFDSKIAKFLQDKKIGCVSKGLRDWLVKTYSLKDKNVQTLYNPIEVSENQINAEIKAPPVQQIINSKPYILVAGRICKQKNQQFAIKVFAQLPNHHKYNLVIMGDGKQSEIKKLKKLAKQIGVSQNVTFIPFQNNPYPIIAKAKLVFSPSLYEGFNMIVAESIACHTPVIASNCDFGPSEILTGDAKGWLFDLCENTNLEIQNKNMQNAAIKLMNKFIIKSHENCNLPNMSKFSTIRCLKVYKEIFENKIC